MADEILSADELNALLAIGEAGLGRPARERQVAEYDFTRPAKLSGEQLRSLRRLHEAMAQNLAAALSAHLKFELAVSLVGLGEATYAAFRDALPNPTLLSVLALPPLAERAVATLDAKLAFSLIDRMLGGPGKSLDRMRALTTLEQNLIDHVQRRFLEQWTRGWHELQAFTPAVESRETEPQFVRAIPTAEMVLVATFSLSAAGGIGPGELSVALPLNALRAALGRLDRQNQFDAMQQGQTPIQRRQLDRVVAESVLELRVAMGTAAVTVGDIMGLRSGDILVLDQAHGDLMSGRIAGRERLLGRPGRIGKKLAFLVERVLPAGQATPDKE